jgi:O-methyltransferase
VDVFTLSPFLREAACFAAHELDVFAALGTRPRSAAEVAQALRVRPRRLRALLDVLALDGVVVRDGDGYRLPQRLPPRPPAPPPHGWGKIAQVIRSDRPLAAGGADPECGDPGAAPAASGVVHDTSYEARFHAHLVAAGADAAREVAALLAGMGVTSLLDAGGGAGGYARAFLDAAPRARATLLDRGSVVPLAAEALAPHLATGRAALVSGDLFDPAALGAGHDAALLANVLHLYSVEDAARIVGHAGRAIAGGGVVVVKEFAIAPDRSGPPDSVGFALNMALYTDGGDVHDAARILALLTGGDAGLIDARIEPSADPGSLIALARRAA